MTALTDRKVLLGITGGIAAYKSALLARGLMAAGAEVRVVMTAGAQAFVQPLTFQALTGHPVHTDLLDETAEAAMGHIELARWADLVLIAPASANTLARLAQGMADDLLSTLCLATSAQLVVAPAMNRLMWAHPATQDNMAKLLDRGAHCIGPAAGEQACGETGAGRLTEPDDILTALQERLATESVTARSEPLRGKHVLITAGPTLEPIDPVRYIGNRSSGRMGFAIAADAARRGAKVTLISGPVSLPSPNGVHRIDVQTALEMHAAVFARTDQADLFIAVAAVADYRSQAPADEKIKKTGDTLTLELIRNPDILAEVAALENAPFCVGFAAETESLEQHARGKLANKRLNLIAANHVADKHSPVFGSDSNALEVFWPDGGHRSIPRAPKTDIAQALLDIVSERLTGKSTEIPGKPV
jgi:phosphopantothenoylcysteine decarboxylase/phosphopantothenate--cysteine ligase